MNLLKIGSALLAGILVMGIAVGALSREAPPPPPPPIALRQASVGEGTDPEDLVIIPPPIFEQSGRSGPFPDDSISGESPDDVDDPALSVDSDDRFDDDSPDSDDSADSPDD